MKIKEGMNKNKVGINIEIEIILDTEEKIEEVKNMMKITFF